MVRIGLEQLLKNSQLKRQLKSQRVSLVGHPASVNRKLDHSLDILMAAGVKLTCAFGPQHGLRGEKQDNMIESADFVDSKYGIPIFSLYGETRRPTNKMLDYSDIVLFDLQDVGCRIYTFLTTLFYVMEDCARTGKSVWVLDRPNPAGRVVEGNFLRPDFFSFVGAAEIVMRHGLTLGEAGLWYSKIKNLNLDYRIIKMTGYNPEGAPHYGWPTGELSWVNPSPNMPRLTTALMYAGTVLIEGTRLSEGRGTTRPLEMMAAPGLDGEKWVKEIYKMIPRHLKGVTLRPCFFEPTFQKHSGKLCSGFQIHIDQSAYFLHNQFRPYRIVCAALKCLRHMHADYDLWLPPPYEYEKQKMPIDILSGNNFLRQWVDDRSAKWGDMEKFLSRDEQEWVKVRKKYLVY